MNIYYGGTFADQSIGELKERRQVFKDKIWGLDLNIKIYDPLRGKALRATDQKDKMEMVYATGHFTPNEIVSRDLNDILHCDIVILNMLKPSIGSSCEMMFANFHRKIILIISTNPSVTEHPWILSLSSKIFSTEKECISYMENYLL